MSQPDAKFINFIVNQADPFISFSESNGFELFRRASAQIWSEPNEQSSKQALLRANINQIANGVAEAPFFTQILLKAYCEYEKGEGAPDFLKNWLLPILDAISSGADANRAFSLIRKRGQKKTKLQQNRLMCVCFVELREREGLSPTKAVQACADHFKTSDRCIWDFKEGVELTSVSSEALKFFSETDISDLYTC